MKVLKPGYYDDFQCLMGKCPLTCCKGWKIEIDEETLDYYRRLPGSFGKQVRKAIDWPEERFSLRNGCCSLMTEEGLCEIHSHLGEEALCDTCRDYPRHMEVFPYYRELSLSLSCPEAAVQILEKSAARNKDLFLETEEEELLEFEDFDSNLFRFLLDTREKLRDLAGKQELSWPLLEERLLKMTLRVQEQADEEDYEAREEDFPAESPVSVLLGPEKDQLELLHSLETIHPEWPRYLEELTESLNRKDGNEENLPGQNGDSGNRSLAGQGIPCSSGELKKRLLDYFLYVYYPGAVYDREILSKVLLAVFFARWSEKLLLVFGGKDALRGGIPDILEAFTLISRFAREIEHSENNLLKIEEYFHEREKLYTLMKRV